MYQRKMEANFPSISGEFRKRSLQIAIITIAVWLSDVVHAEDCGQEELAACSKPLRVLSETVELSFVTKKEELDKICPDLHSGLHCIRSFSRRCMSMTQREHFNKLYHGTNEMIHDLCEKGQYQEDFLRHAPCMRHIKKDYEICAINYQNVIARIGQRASSMEAQQRHNQQHRSQATNSTAKAIDEDEDQVKTVCCAFTKYALCSERIVRQSCGDETAKFTKKFLEKMSNSLMRMHCEGYGPETGICDERVEQNHANLLGLSTSCLLITLTGLLYSRQ